MPVIALLLGATLMAPTSPPEADPAAWAAVQRFLSEWRKVETLEYVMHKTERMADGSVIKEVVLVKLRRPGQIYLGAIEPKAGQEVIYDAARNPKELTVHPGSFPDLTLDLSIAGSLTTKNQHHMITGTGYTNLANNLRAGFEKPPEQRAGGRIEHAGADRFNGRKVDKVIIHTGDLPHRKIKAPKDESVLAFGRRVGVAPYLIVYLNPTDLDGIADSVSAGQTYVVPHNYGKRIELLLDERHGLSLRTTIYDWQGRLYERYEHRDMVVNQKFTDADFDPDNPHYDF